MAGIKKGSGRWATIVKDTGEVSNIHIMTGGVEPETRNNAKDKVEVVEVDDTVAVGMIRGGKNGFTWPEGKDRTSSIGATRISDAADAPGDHAAKSRGNTAPKEAKKAEEPTPQPEEVKRTPQKTAKEKAAAEEEQPEPVTPAAVAASKRETSPATARK